MVLLTQVLRSIEKKPRKSYRGFIDSLRIHVTAGHGGNGLPKYGGVGGQGGSVFCVARENQSLKNVEKRWATKRIVAGPGGNSNPNAILGAMGSNIEIEVPVGVSVHREDEKLIGDLNEPGATVQVCRGGLGGSHRSGFIGLKGQSRMIRLDLKLIADIGLVGFPNAGKSTLLNAVSRAKPKIASYPFTTIRPNIGIIEYPNLRRISMADLPGLIEGAHANIGMGHKFLKHVERTKMLLLIVDINGFQLSPRHKFRSCLENVILLNKELELYKTELLDKPATLIVNKMDTPGAKEKYKEIEHQLTNLKDIISDFPEEMRPERLLVFDDVLPISAKTDTNAVQYVKDRLNEILDLNAEITKQKEIENQLLLEKLNNEVKEKFVAGAKAFHKL